MPALLQAFARLVALKRLGVLLFVLAATLCASRTASAFEHPQTKTRVWGFDFAEHNSDGLFSAASSGKHQGNRFAQSEVASGSLLAARGAAAQVHHIASDKAIKSGFTAAFQRIFSRAGMTLNDAANKVTLQGHLGRHSAKYHQYVLSRLLNATQGLTGAQVETALRAELSALANELLANPQMVKGIGLP